MKAAFVGAVAGVAGRRRAEATVACAAPYESCQDDALCCGRGVCEFGICMPGCRIDGVFINASMSPPENSCAICDPNISTTALQPANEGMSCWSGDPGAGLTFCQSGVCASAGPVQCPPPAPCHTDLLIDPATCTYAVAEAGAPCGGQAMCHGGFFQPADACDGQGFCIGGGSKTVSCAPFACGEGSCLISCASDTDCVDGNSCCDGNCVRVNTVEHCSGCGDACAVPPEHGQAICESGACGIACDAGYGVCRSICLETPAIPDTIVGAQIEWLIGFMNGGVDTITEAEFYEHFHEVWDFGEVVAFFQQPAHLAMRPRVFSSYVEPVNPYILTFELIGAESYRQTVRIQLLGTEPHTITGLVLSSALGCPAG